MRKFGLMLFAVLVLSAMTLGAQSYAGKKVLFIDSYHEGYPWSDGITKGVKDVIAPSGAELRIHRMDTKRNPGEEFKKEAALKTKQLIDSWQPDVVIAADDNASQYIIKEYYKDSKLPFVFCGVNWDSSIYGFPYANVTGMEEVALVEPLLKQLKEHAKGDRIGYLASDTATTHKEAEYYRKLFGIDPKEVYVSTYADWKKAFKEMQDQVDMMIVGNTAGINDFDQEDAEKFVVSATSIPTGSIYEWMAPLALISYTVVAEEQGTWAANAALKILGGASPGSIPITQNKEGNLFLNMRIANALKIVFKPAVVKTAKLIK